MTPTHAHAPAPLTLIGCGAVFDAIAADPAAYGITHFAQRLQVAGVSEIAANADALLAQAGQTDAAIFVAVDSNALNYARLELYGRARLHGLKLSTLVSLSAHLAADVQLADNVWVGPAAIVGHGITVGANVQIGAGARLDAGARIAAHVTIGAGASIGAACRLGSHTVVGADVQLRAGATLGKHCLLDSPGPWQQTLDDGHFLDPMLTRPARIVGPGYSLRRKPQA